MFNLEVLGRNIRAARDRLGNVTQEDVATKLELSERYYGRIERGEVPTNLERLAEICVILDLPIESAVAGTLPIGEYENKPPYDDVGARLTILANGCDAKHRAAMLRVCEEIARLDKETI